MSKTKFGVAVSENIEKGLDQLVGECEDLDASRSEVVEACLTHFIASDIEHEKRVRELIIRRRKGTLDLESGE
jgi:Arc/MetJ-type ribon-helix-helix transcriptional regulator